MNETWTEIAAHHRAEAEQHEERARQLGERARRIEARGRWLMPLLWGFVALLHGFLAVAYEDIPHRAAYLFATLAYTILACHWRWGMQ